MSESNTISRTGWRVHQRVISVWALRVGLFAAVILAWVLATTVGGISPLILPSIPKVLEAFVEIVTTGSTWAQAGITVLEMLIAFALATVAGLIVGFLLSRTRLAALTSEPLFAWGYMFPLALLYPMFLIWAGVGMQSKIFYAALGAFFPIAYNTIRGLSSIDERYLKVGTAFGASKYQVDTIIKFGAARPMILAGLRIGSSIVTIYVVLAELLGSNAGLGHEIEGAQSRLQIPDSYALVALLIIITVILQRIMEYFLRSKHE